MEQGTWTTAQKKVKKLIPFYDTQLPITSSQITRKDQEGKRLMGNSILIIICIYFIYIKESVYLYI